MKWRILRKKWTRSCAKSRPEQRHSGGDSRRFDCSDRHIATEHHDGLCGHQRVLHHQPFSHVPKHPGPLRCPKQRLRLVRKAVRFFVWTTSHFPHVFMAFGTNLKTASITYVVRMWLSLRRAPSRATHTPTSDQGHSALMMELEFAEPLSRWPVSIENGDKSMRRAGESRHYALVSYRQFCPFTRGNTNVNFRIRGLASSLSAGSIQVGLTAATRTDRSDKPRIRNVSYVNLKPKLGRWRSDLRFREVYEN
jgi:hypothetical protein